MAQSRKVVLLSCFSILVSCAQVVLAIETQSEQTENIFQDKLTGDWDGNRSDYLDNGVSLDFEYTMTYQGLTSGVGSKSFGYGGKLDSFIKLDFSKMGGWEDTTLVSHLEFRHGNDSAFKGGAIWPTNSAQALPLGADEELVATSLYLTTKIGDSSSLLFGKINVLDFLAGDPFFGGWGNRRFMNVAFVAPPSGVLPPTIFGVIGNLSSDSINWNFMLFDPNDRTTEYFPDDLFSDGVNLSINASSNLTISGRETGFSAGVTYSTKAGTDLSDVLLPPNLEAGEKDGSYSITTQISHSLSEQTEKYQWGVYIKASLADGNPNPIQSSIIGGIAGQAFFTQRPDDSFGLGFYYYEVSSDLIDALDPVKNLDSEKGIELFYNYSVTPWLNITGDIQYVDPTSGDNKNATVIGVRANLIL